MAAAGGAGHDEMGYRCDICFERFPFEHARRAHSRKAHEVMTTTVAVAGGTYEVKTMRCPRTGKISCPCCRKQLSQNNAQTHIKWCPSISM